jgi:hypothetical protein
VGPLVLLRRSDLIARISLRDKLCGKERSGVRTVDIGRMGVVSTMLLPARQAREGALVKRADTNSKTFVVVRAVLPCPHTPYIPNSGYVATGLLTRPPDCHHCRSHLHHPHHHIPPHCQIPPAIPIRSHSQVRGRQTTVPFFVEEVWQETAPQ